MIKPAKISKIYRIGIDPMDLKWVARWMRTRGEEEESKCCREVWREAARAVEEMVRTGEVPRETKD